MQQVEYVTSEDGLIVVGTTDEQIAFFNKNKDIIPKLPLIGTIDLKELKIEGVMTKCFYRLKVYGKSHMLGRLKIPRILYNQEYIIRGILLLLSVNHNLGNNIIPKSQLEIRQKRTV